MIRKQVAIIPALALLALLHAGCGANAGFLAGSEASLSAAGKSAANDSPLGMENFTKVNAGLYRGGLPTDEQMKGLQKLGIKTDVNLMGGAGDAQERALVAHEKEVAEKLGITFINLAVPFNVDVPESMVLKWLQVAQDSANQPVYIHCRHGRDRTGMMVGAYRIAYDGYTGQQALDEMKTFGFKPDKYPFFAKFVLNFKPVVTLGDFALTR